VDARGRPVGWPGDSTEVHVVRDFKAFVLRGNVVDLAVGVVIGAAFGTVVESLVKNLFTPLIGLPGSVNFSDLAFTVRHSTFRYGLFLNDVISFLTIALTVFLFVVKPVNTLMSRSKTEMDVLSRTKTCPECLSEIPARARRCAFCTSEVAED
jgi:large conductance mechanosensitive channel